MNKITLRQEEVDAVCECIRNGTADSADSLEAAIRRELGPAPEPERLDLLPQIEVGQKFMWARLESVVDEVGDSLYFDKPGIRGHYVKDGDRKGTCLWELGDWYKNATLLPVCPSCGDQYDPESGHDCKPATFEVGDVVESIIKPSHKCIVAAEDERYVYFGVNPSPFDRKYAHTHFRLVSKGGAK